jgi:hypothetical protein
MQAYTALPWPLPLFFLSSCNHAPDKNSEQPAVGNATVQ